MQVDLTIHNIFAYVLGGRYFGNKSIKKHKRLLLVMIVVAYEEERRRVNRMGQMGGLQGSSWEASTS